MTVAPAPDHGAKRRIGDILLELGFASEAQIAKAAEQQDETGQPLGQILVEQGVITRLELASALAEQWSAHAPIQPLPIPSAMPRMPPQPVDEDQYAARLQAAVADLTQKVQEHESSEGADPRVTELAERLEATVARAQRLEATVATLAESLDGVTGGVEEAFAVLQSGMSGLAHDLARLDTTVSELALRPAEPEPDAELAERLDALARAVDDLAARPQGDEAAHRRADELAARVDSLADASEVGELRRTLEQVQRRLDEVDTREAVAADLAEQRDVLGDLRAAVAELEARPTGTPEVDERLGRIETQLEQRLAGVAGAAAVEALAATLDALGRRVDDLARPDAGPGADAVRRVEALEATVRGLAPEHVLDDLRQRLDRLGDEVREQASLGPRLDAAEEATRAAVTPAALAEAVERLHDEIAAAAPEPDERVDVLLERVDREHTAADARLGDLERTLAEARVELRRELDALRDEVGAARAAAAPDPAAVGAVQALAERADALEARLAGGVVSPDELTRALDRARDELGPAPAEPDPRVDRLVQEVETLRHGLAAAPTTDPAIAVRLEEVASEVESLRAALDRAREELRPAPVDPDPRVERLGDDVRALQEALVQTRLELQPREAGPDPRVERLAEDVERLRAALDRARNELRPAPVEPDPRVDRLVDDLQSLREEIAAAPRPQPDTAAVEQLAHLAARVDGLAEDVRRARESGPAASPEPDPRLAQLASDMLVLRAEMARVAAAPDPKLAARVSALASRLELLEAPPPEPALTVADVERLLDDRLAQIGESLAVASVPPAAAAADAAPRTAVSGIPAPEGIEGDLERTRMAIERLGAHLGEHDRAIRELMKASRREGGGGGSGTIERAGERGVVDRSEAAGDMRALQRRLEGMEQDAREDREKLMKRLERMATSIDWRLQRLEADQ